MPTILIPDVLTKFTNHQSKIIVNCDHLKDVRAALIKDFPEIEQYLFDDKHNIRPFISIYLNGKQIHPSSQQELFLESDDVITLFLPLVGG